MDKASSPGSGNHESSAASESGDERPASVRVSYALGWFTYHAGQRLTAFHFFLIVAPVLLLTYFRAIEIHSRTLGIIVAFLGCMITVAFWLLDIRNLELVNIGRNVLDQV